MTRRLFLPFVLFATCAVWLGSEHAMAEGDLILGGRVVDENGKPVAEYTVWATPPREHRYRFGRRRLGSVTDAKGYFLIAGLFPGDYQLFPDRSPTHTRFESRTVRAGGDSVRIEVVAYRVVEGIVRDPAGKPLPGASVLIEPMPGFAAPGDSYRTPGGEALRTAALADADGKFRFERYPSFAQIRARVAPPPARHADLVPTDIDGITPGKADLCLVVPTGLTIAGRILDERGQPIAGATISATGSLSYPHGQRRRRYARNAVSGADGRYSLQPFSPGEAATLRVRGPPAADPAWFGTTVRAVAAGRIDKDIVLTRGGVVAGTIEGLSAAELRGLTVTANDLTVRLDGTTNAFRIHPLGKGKVRLRFGHHEPEYLVVPKRVEFDAPKTGLVYRVARAHTLRGHITSRLEPHRLNIDYYDAWGRRHWYGKVAADGSFQVAGVPPGPGLLYVTASMGSRALIVDAADPTAAPLELKLGSARRIVGRIAGLPTKVEGGTVTARRGPLSVRASIEEDGWFDIAPLAPGRWALEFKLRKPGGVVAPLESIEAGNEYIVAEWSDER